MAARSKFVLVPASSGHRGALREVMADPAVLARLADTKAARETMAIQKFTKMLDEDPDRAYYGCVRCSTSMSLCGSRRQVASRRSITIFTFSSTLIFIPSHCSLCQCNRLFTFSSTLIFIPSHCSLCQCNRLFIFSLVLKSSSSCSSSSSSFYNFSFLIWPFFNFLFIVSFFVSSPAPHRYNHVLLANESQAIDTLMVTDSLFRSCDIPTRRRYVDLVEKATENGATVLIFSSLHVSGERLASLSGIAAILRFVRVRAHCPSQSATAGTNTLWSRNRALATLPHLLQRRVGPRSLYRSAACAHVRTHFPISHTQNKDAHMHARKTEMKGKAGAVHRHFGVSFNKCCDASTPH
jgi:hypothetical protein